MVPAGEAVEESLFGKSGLADLLSHGDTVIEGGNSFYKDSIRRAEELEKRGIRFVDVGVSGGPGGARRGPSLGSVGHTGEGKWTVDVARE